MPGARIGVYEIIAPLGAGGMGEVYRARDSRLNRDVALKILPERVAGDPERLSRLRREAQLLASLNHPNIGAIYGFEDDGGVQALVLELIEGPTLADRIAQGPMPLEEALPIARQISAAVESAHEQGVIHRDLKPANIKIRPDGTVKVLDFGLAKLNDPNASNASNGPNGLSMSPTLSLAATNVGVILGTAAYMAPEQARGRAVDKRADVWAFGCVLFEMVTGRPVFEGEDLSEILASVIKSGPALERLPADIHPPLRHLIARCLEKDVRNRYRDMGDVRYELERIGAEPFVPPSDAERGVVITRRRRAILMGAAAAALALGVGLLIGGSQTPAAITGNVALLEASTPAELALAREEPYYPVMSPDARFVAFAGQKNGLRSLYVRTMTDGSVRDFASPVTGNRFFWMPDSRWIVFVAEGAFWRAQVDDRQRVRIGPGPPGNFVGGSANAAGVLIFASSEGIYRVTENEAPPLILKSRDDDGNYAAPTFLPDGNRFLFTIRDGPRAGVVMGNLGSDAVTSIVPGLTADVHYAAGYIVYVLEGQVVARSLDIEATSPVVGDPRVLVSEGAGARAHSDAAGESLSFSYGPYGMRQLLSLDRAGRVLSRVGTPSQFRELDISADGRRLAANLGSPGEASRLAVVDVETGGASPVTAFAIATGNPRWGRDTRRVFFNAITNGVYAIYARDVATGETTLVRPFDQTNQYLDDVSPDGSMLLYHGGTDVWAAPTGTSGTPVRVVHVLSGNLDQPSYSPDMRFIAFNTTETGRSEVNVVPAQPDGQRWQISRSGGAQPVWSADGSELFYLALDGTLMTAAVPRGGTDWSAAIPRPLFASGVDLVDPGQEQYVVSPRGDRFFVTVPIENSRRHSFGVLLGWRSLLQAN